MKFARWSYRAVLRLYPAAFRQEYGPDMTQFFADRLREARSRGGIAVVRCFSRSIYDAVVQAARERHTRRDSPRKRQSQHMSTLLQDLRYGVRTLLRAPVFTAVTDDPANAGLPPRFSIAKICFRLFRPRGSLFAACFARLKALSPVVPCNFGSAPLWSSTSTVGLCPSSAA